MKFSNSALAAALAVGSAVAVPMNAAREYHHAPPLNGGGPKTVTVVVTNTKYHPNPPAYTAPGVFPSGGGESSIPTASGNPKPIVSDYPAAPPPGVFPSGGASSHSFGFPSGYPRPSVSNFPASPRPSVSSFPANPPPGVFPSGGASSNPTASGYPKPIVSSFPASPRPSVSSFPANPPPGVFPSGGASGNPTGYPRPSVSSFPVVPSSVSSVEASSVEVSSASAPASVSSGEASSASAPYSVSSAVVSSVEVSSASYPTASASSIEVVSSNLETFTDLPTGSYFSTISTTVVSSAVVSSAVVSSVEISSAVASSASVPTASVSSAEISSASAPAYASSAEISSASVPTASVSSAEISSTSISSTSAPAVSSNLATLTDSPTASISSIPASSVSVSSASASAAPSGAPEYGPQNIMVIMQKVNIQVIHLERLIDFDIKTIHKQIAHLDILDPQDLLATISSLKLHLSEILVDIVPVLEGAKEYPKSITETDLNVVLTLVAKVHSIVGNAEHTLKKVVHTVDTDVLMVIGAELHDVIRLILPITGRIIKVAFAVVVLADVSQDILVGKITLIVNQIIDVTSRITGLLIDPIMVPIFERIKNGARS